MALVSCDVYRPAAIEQLKTVASQANAQFCAFRGRRKACRHCRRAVDHARTHYWDVLIVDTAGRLAIDEEMMQEIAELHAALKPVETLFVVDAMQGQDAVNVARAFNERLPLTGVVLTKLDGDARGGAALRCDTSPASRSSSPVWARSSTASKFHPERMAPHPRHGRHPVARRGGARKIDLAEASVRREGQEGQGVRPRGLQAAIVQMKKMGGVASLKDKLPASSRPDRPGEAAGRDAVHRIEGIINSMTRTERRSPRSSRPRASAASPPAPACRCRQ